MNTKTNILIAIPKLTAGGAERVLSFLAKNLNRNNYNVTLLVVGSEKDNKYDVSGTDVIYLNKGRVRHAIFAIIKTIIKVKPKIVLCSISDLNFTMGYISMLFPSIKFVGRHTFIINKEKYSNQKSDILNFNFRLYGLKKLDYFICQSQDMKQSIIKYYGLDKNKLKIINNPITNIHNIEKTNSSADIRKYITVGRLIKVKGHNRLLNVLKKVNHPFEFTIIGSGSSKTEIFSEIEKLNLSDRIKYVEYTDKVEQYLVENDVFLQGSYSEGFPNALLESCSVGVPAIAFDAPGGTKEIIDNGINGYLVKSEEEFVDKLNEQKRWEPKEVKESVDEKFGATIILKKYEDFFQKIINQ